MAIMSIGNWPFEFVVLFLHVCKGGTFYLKKKKKDKVELHARSSSHYCYFLNGRHCINLQPNFLRCVSVDVYSGVCGRR